MSALLKASMQVCECNSTSPVMQKPWLKKCTLTASISY
uniref:Uncharacterized protein n=1 Tax=Anguilla anguilla TaxID=7936 RepID=A0A0E9TR13_ANGAN